MGEQMQKFRVWFLGEKRSAKEFVLFEPKSAAELFIVEKLSNDVEPEEDYEVCVQSEDGHIDTFEVSVEIVLHSRKKRS